MRIFLPVLVFTICIGAVYPITSTAAASVRLTPDLDYYPLGEALEILEDPSGKLTIDQVSSAPWSARFRPSQSAEPNFGMTDSVYWVRLRLVNQSGYQRNWILQQGYPNTQHLSLYLPRANGGFEVRDSGLLHPFRVRDLPYHLILFDLPGIPDRGETLYLRFQNGSNMVLSLSLWRPAAFIEASWHYRLLQGIFLGCLLIMVAYNAFLGVSLRDPAYLWFLLFVTGVLVTQATSDGLGAQYLWPDTPWINAYAIQSAAAFGLSCLILFTMRFLDTRKQAPGLHRILQAELVAWLGLVLLLPWVRYGFGVRIAFVLILATSLAVLLSALLCRLRGYAPARYFLVGGLVLLLALVVMVLTRIGLLPSNIVTQQLGYQLGTVLFMLSMSFALADRINSLKRQREDAQKQALAVSTAHQRLIQQQNIQLERQVAERTRDLVQAKDAAEAANRAKSAFLATMSHELRTPLNAILGYARILKSQVRGRSERQGLDVIEDSGNHLLTVLNDVLDLARVEAGRLHLRRSDFALRPFLDALTEMFHVQAVQGGPRVLLKTGDGLPTAVHGDEQRLRQVLINLIGNGVKFSADVDVEVGVRVAKRHADGSVELLFEVEDRGPGIPAEEQGRIFESFKQGGAGQAQSRGSGLGLAVSRRLVELMGGELRLESQVGVGSRFWFVVPVGIETGLPAAARPNTTPPLNGHGKRLLIVDDHAVNRTLLRAMLAPGGFEFTEAADGEEALAAARRTLPDAIILDLLMPGLDGFGLIHRLRADRTLAAIPLIANSASAFEADQRRAMEAGADVFLAKPLDPWRLSCALRRLLRPIPSAEPLTAPSTIPDAETLECLYDLCRRGSVDRIAALMEEVKQDDPALAPYSVRLTALARSYRLEDLREAIIDGLCRRHDSSPDGPRAMD